MGAVFPHDYLSYVKPLDLTDLKPTSRLDLESADVQLDILALHNEFL
jgi:hypothetical protein